MRFRLVHQALAQRCEFVDRLDAHQLVARWVSDRAKGLVNFDEPTPVVFGRERPQRVAKLLHAADDRMARARCTQEVDIGFHMFASHALCRRGGVIQGVLPIQPRQQAAINRPPS